jgi:hypothetical protein
MIPEIQTQERLCESAECSMRERSVKPTSTTAESVICAGTPFWQAIEVSINFYDSKASTFVGGGFFCEKGVELFGRMW